MTCLQDHLHYYLQNNIEKNHYKILNIPKNSTNNDIRKAYIKLSHLYHPDKCLDLHSKELFQLISTSYISLTETKNEKIITLEDSLQLFYTIFDKQDYKLYIKLICDPKELTIKETMTIGYSFYKLFNK